ncbi:hypothetical protein [Mesorhizobium sp. CN2-181]|uniref:hypothetical protein n=1 Tax=Mesorhizobium yinganensis TaxID=3157707 RepID=UPI0032B814FB
MRAARHLVAEMELWKLCWQQVEAFVDRVEGARDQDNSAEARFHALLNAALVVERERALRSETAPLGDPVVTGEPRPSLATGWTGEYRIWRLPGADEAELAVAQLYEEPGSGQDPVQLLPPRDFYSYFVEPSDKKFAKSDNGEITVRMPAYPGAGTATIIGTAASITTNPIMGGILTPDIKEDGDIVSLFSPDRREDATLDIDQTGEWIQTWSELTSKRRDNRASASEGDVKYFGASGSTTAWSAGTAQEALTLCDNVIAGRPAVGTFYMATALKVAEAARGAAQTVAGNAQILRDAAEVLDETGTRSADIPGLLRTTADGLAPRPDLFVLVADAADALAPLLAVSPNSTPSASTLSARKTAAEALRAAAGEVLAAMSGANLPLLMAPPEAGPLGPELDETLAERIAYPDGSLRILRALEQGFVRFWPSRMRWFLQRNRLTLGIAMARFRAPFLAGLRALLRGGDTGFPVDGLSVLTPAATRSTKLRLGHPASLLPAMSDVEAGHMVLTTEGRSAAMTVLGVTGDQGRLAFDISPLRVSTAPSPAAGPEDSPGLINPGQALDTFVPGTGLSVAALMGGEDPSDPVRDGPVESAVILYSQLALLFGWKAVEPALSSSVPTYAARSIPDPSGMPLESLHLYGGAPANVTTFVIRGAGAQFLDMSVPSAPRPRIARPGEHLLIRGRAKGEDDGRPGQIRQAAIMAGDCYAIPAQAFHRMDKSAIALLSTTPLPSGDIDACLAGCRPEEPLIMLVLERTWQTFELVSEVTLRRDFDGFDLPSLAAGTLMPVSVIQTVTGSPPPGPADVERSGEFKAARGYLEEWTRFARR